ncbi:MAG TPA: hypothetical protein VIG33_13545 [Pseudobdellovibrionaceae bacterium]|jgi:hypothetical protein
MRSFFTLFILSISFFAQAQTVEKITGNEALVTVLASESLTVGDKVNFLNENLNISGQGEVTKLSSGGKKAIVKIISGNAKPGMSLETLSATPRPNKSLMVDTLDEEDRRILHIGEISTSSYVIGGILGTYPLGLGIGHAIQGRYMDKGWIFTVGELGSLAVVMGGVGSCLDSISNSSRCNGGAWFLGAMGYVGFRIWEIIDVWAAPPEINRRYHNLKFRMESRAILSPLLAPTRDGAVFGLRMTF